MALLKRICFFLLYKPKPSPLTTAEITCFLSGSRVAHVWLTCGSRVALVWLACGSRSSHERAIRAGAMLYLVPLPELSTSNYMNAERSSSEDCSSMGVVSTAL